MSGAQGGRALVHVGELNGVIVIDDDLTHTTAGQHLHNTYANPTDADHRYAEVPHTVVVLHYAHRFERHEPRVGLSGAWGGGASNGVGRWSSQRGQTECSEQHRVAPGYKLDVVAWRPELTFDSETSALITSTFCRRTRRGPVVEEYIRTTS